MALAIDPFNSDPGSRFKLFYELMQWKVRDILLVSTPYDAWVLEEDCRLSERIINEYRGLNLSQPPRLTWVQSAEEALRALENKPFDLVLTMSHLSDMEPGELGRKVKARAPELPVILLSHMMIVNQAPAAQPSQPPGVDHTFVWAGDTDILVALVKCAEDRMNADRDTRTAGIRILLFVQNSPYYLSSLLPILYREVVSQTQSVMESGLNEEHRLLTMRARPKILIAKSYEEALELFARFEPYILGVISDTHIPRDGRPDAEAGLDLLSHIHAERFDIPLLVTGSNRHDNRGTTTGVPASFADKNALSFRDEVRVFFKDHLGFGDFVFRMPHGRETGRARNLRTLAEGIQSIPREALEMHCRRNDFSRWLFARTEISLASRLRPLTDEDFPDLESHRRYLIQVIQDRRRRRHMGVVANFDASDFDPQTEFAKIGRGSLGGKARGLAFLGSLLKHNHQLHQAFEGVRIHIPQTLVITTEGFETFVEDNNLMTLARSDVSDEEIAQRFLAAKMPPDLKRSLEAYLAHTFYPLAVRSSSLLEDAQHHAYAGLYRTYMLPNDNADRKLRLYHLTQAVKLVYASTFFQGPRAYARRVGHRTQEEKMAVVIQQLVGNAFNGVYYPAISGVAQSYNYYPQARMQPDDGIAIIALGLGKMVVAGERSLRFCPRYPKILPQRSSVDDILAYAQRSFYALRMGFEQPLGLDDGATLVRREIGEAIRETPLQMLAGTYVPEEHRIRDSLHSGGYPVVTFASVLKYALFPLAGLLEAALSLGTEGMGRPVELEFAVNLAPPGKSGSEFALLQMRPMTARATAVDVKIDPSEISTAVCYSQRAMGNTCHTLRDIVYVKPDAFDPGRTDQIAREVAHMNGLLDREGRKYVLMGPGRWGSEDRWLGIPVQWSDISGVGAIVETVFAELKAEPSQGSHFFHNLAALEISYLCVTGRKPDHLDWSWLTGLSTTDETEHVAHVRLSEQLVVKVDGRSSCGLIAVAQTAC